MHWVQTKWEEQKKLPTYELFMFSLCVSCYFSGRKPHYLMFKVVFWLLPWWGAALTPLGCELEKALKSVKYKTKSMSISLVTLPLLLPHICPLLSSSLLTPPQIGGMTLLTMRVESEMKVPQGNHVFSGVLPTSSPASPKRRDHVSSSLCCVREVKSPHTSVSHFYIKITITVPCHRFWPAQRLRHAMVFTLHCLWVKKHALPQNWWWLCDWKLPFIWGTKRFWHASYEVPQLTV